MGPIVGLALVVLSFAGGCEVTAEKIQVWKDSVNGPPKIRAAIRDTSQDFKVRVLAAQAMAELGHFGPLKEDLESLEQADRAKLTKELVDQLLARMKGTSAQATTELQVQAKDALFSLRPAVAPEIKRSIERALVGWVLADWRRRRGGDHSGEKIARAVGAPAAKQVLAQLVKDPGLVDTFAPLLAKIAASAERRQAAASLVALATKQRGEQAKTLAALALFKQPASRAYLLALAKSATASVDVRQNALVALARCADDSVLDDMAALATNPKEEGSLRDAAMSVFDNVGSLASLDRLGRIVAGQDKILRFRAAEALVSCCKAKGVAKLLQSLPSRYAYAKQDVKDYLEKDVGGLGKAALPPLRQALESTSWIARVIAVRLLGSLGAKQDLVRLERLVDDKSPLPGWKATLGSEARQAVQHLKKRLSKGQEKR